ncbi:MAG: response regulator [Deltaproteobacteria bacterium]|nr:MAG: response regulator [Deltaproteobacteria bacterium]
MPSKTILIVDDERPILSALGRVARRAGYPFEAFDDADAALEAVQAGLEPVAAIVDHNMPGTDGLTLAERLRALRPGLRILMLSGGIPGREIVEARARGLLWFYAEKPWELEWMRRVLVALVEDEAPPLP